jgi:hypothetical protein
MNTQEHRRLSYVLRFESLFDGGRALAFSEKAKLNYLYARTVIGRDFAVPRVELH